MIDQKTLGRRIKYFRKRADMSQLQLEAAMNASEGSISRIESGKVNPSKETVRKIASILEMNNRELDYLIGVTSKPASQLEIQEAVREVQDYFLRNDVFAYLIDERWRLLAFSKNVERLYRIFNWKNSNKAKDYILSPLLSIFLSGEDKISGVFKSSKYEDFLYYQFQRFYREVGYMEDDSSYEIVQNLIMEDPFYREIWEKSVSEPVKSNSYMSKQVTLKMMGQEFNLQYSREILSISPRFETIEVFPNKNFFGVLKSRR